MLEFILRYIMLSSAKRRILDWMFSLMSLMYSKTSIGPRTEPISYKGIDTAAGCDLFQTTADTPESEQTRLKRLMYRSQLKGLNWHYSGVSRVGFRGGFQNLWLVKVSASIVSTPWLKKNLGRGGFRATKKKPGYATALCGLHVVTAWHHINRTLHLIECFTCT